MPSVPSLKCKMRQGRQRSRFGGIGGACKSVHWKVLNLKIILKALFGADVISLNMFEQLHVLSGPECKGAN